MMTNAAPARTRMSICEAGLLGSIGRIRQGLDQQSASADQTDHFNFAVWPQGGGGLGISVDHHEPALKIQLDLASARFRARDGNVNRSHQSDRAVVIDIASAALEPEQIANEERGR